MNTSVKPKRKMDFTIVLDNDNPIMVRKRLAQKFYIPRVVKTYEDVEYEYNVQREMKAHEARSLGIKIKKCIPDDQIVTIDTKERKIIKEKIYRTLLRSRISYNRKTRKTLLPRYSKHRSERIEMANGARERPFSFIHSDKLRERIQSEIDYWSNNDMIGRKFPPVLLCFLGVKELQEGDVNIYTRKLFYIKEFLYDSMIVSDKQDKVFYIDFPVKAQEASIENSFVLFLPSNARLVKVE